MKDEGDNNLYLKKVIYIDMTRTIVAVYERENIQASSEDRPPGAQACAFSGYSYTRRGYKALRITEKGTIKHHWYWYWREWHQRYFAQT